MDCKAHSSRGKWKNVVLPVPFVTLLFISKEQLLLEKIAAAWKSAVPTFSFQNILIFEFFSFSSSSVRAGAGWLLVHRSPWGSPFLEAPLKPRKVWGWMRGLGFSSQKSAWSLALCNSWEKCLNPNLAPSHVSYLQKGEENIWNYFLQNISLLMWSPWAVPDSGPVKQSQELSSKAKAAYRVLILNPHKTCTFSLITGWD